MVIISIEILLNMTFSSCHNPLSHNSDYCIPDKFFSYINKTFRSPDGWLMTDTNLVVLALNDDNPCQNFDARVWRWGGKKGL